MLNWKLINWTIGICFVGLNILGIGLSHHRRQAEAASQRSRLELRSRQADQLALWHGSPTLSFGDSTCTDVIRHLGQSPELEAMASGDDIGWEGLTNDEAKDLTTAIYDLMQAFRKDGAKHVMNYMRTRGETLDAGKIGQIRDYLVKRHGLVEEEFAQRSLQEQFVLYWDALDSRTGWKAFIPEYSGIRIWTSDSVTSELLGDVSTLCESDRFLWQFRTERYHNFAHPTDTPSAHLAKYGEAKVADVRLVVEHDGKGVHTICPYAIRFWYSAERDKWVPHLLAVYPTSRDIPNSLLF